MVQRRLQSRALAQIVLTLCVASTTLSLAAQESKTMLVEPAAPLLPAKFGPWQLEGTPACNDCFEPQGQLAIVFKEDGLKRASQQTYHQTGNKETLQIEAYQFVDATGAYSAFTYLRGPGMKSLPNAKSPGGDTASAGSGDFLVWRGTSVVKAIASRVHPTTSDELRQLALLLPKVGGPKALPPLLPTLLPQKGLDESSIRYSLGPTGYQAMGGSLPSDILGFDKAAEVATAKYSGQGLLTLLMLPTPQIAGDRGHAIAAELTKEGSAAGTVKLRREGPLLVLTTGAWRPADAQAMVEGIHLRSEVTWNKAVPPEFHTEVQKTVSLLSGILIFCGLGTLAAIVLGLFFGGGRAAIRVLQGKPAATEPEFLRIDLGGRSAPIHPDTPGAQSKG